ncbi:hypothetical protein M378DRAFT_165111 [Amanita muscaria Koide BX008]|uniref:Uncharacterized protein n=1 Tax=Amanita muscaria (strain Koide BX008) TaxID=946122 RepID=A0A0C2WN57_AMAMK|nr:hypothetical protein M378DRAFT_165111 [Amanita muscaria Koide BX008]
MYVLFLDKELRLDWPTTSRLGFLGVPVLDAMPRPSLCCIAKSRIESQNQPENEGSSS